MDLKWNLVSRYLSNQLYLPLFRDWKGRKERFNLCSIYGKGISTRSLELALPIQALSAVEDALFSCG